MKLKYIYWDDDTGYGTSAKQIIKTLRKFGVEVIEAGLKHHPGQAEYTLPVLSGDQDYLIVILHSAPYYIQRLIEKDKINIAYCTWETTVLPSKWVDVLNLCDAVFVPSYFNKNCFESSGLIKPIHVLPHISEFEGLAVQDEHLPLSGSHPFTFYSIGMWTNRKNNLALLQAFHRTFATDEPVRFILKTSLKDYTKPAYYLLRKLGISTFNKVMDSRLIRNLLKNDPRIEIHTDVWTSHQIAELHRKSDCFISCCRSEGWGMGAYEAAWFGKPVIITNFGGQCDFLSKEDAYLLPFNLVPIQERVWTEYNTDNQHWAEPDMEVAMKKMREVFSNQQEAQARGFRTRAFVANHFNSKKIIETFIQDLQLLHDQS